MSSSFSLQTFQPPRHTSPQMEKCHHFQKNTTHTNSYVLCLCRKENVAEKKKKRKCFVINGGGGFPQSRKYIVSKHCVCKQVALFLVICNDW